MADYSRTPQQELATALNKGYIGVHIEQGVPILDRDLNLLNDLIAATVRSIVHRYIGNGPASGARGFAIQALPAANNFRIAAGAPAPGLCLVNGIEVAIAADVDYGAQAGVQALTTPTVAQPDPRQDTVYLDVWLADVDGTVDLELLNAADIGLQTSLRQRPEWRVRVAEGVPVPAPLAGHAHYTLAQLTRPRGVADVTAAMVSDLRQPVFSLTDVGARLALMERVLLMPAFAASPNQFNPKFGVPGTSVRLFGSNFGVGAVVVRFGTVQAVLDGPPTDGALDVRVPTMAAGPVPITVQTVGGVVTTVDTFAVLAPPPPTMAASPNQFNPKFGVANTSVTVFGSNFDVGGAVVRFGTTNATLVGTPTATQIVARVPSMPSGAVKIAVQTFGGAVTSVDNFTVQPPPAPPTFAASPNQFNPKFGAAGVNVTLLGNNFNTATVLAVRFGTTVASFSGVTATQMVATVPVMPAGPVTITIETSAGSTTSVDTFSVL